MFKFKEEEIFNKLKGEAKPGKEEKKNEESLEKKYGLIRKDEAKWMIKEVFNQEVFNKNETYENTIESLSHFAKIFFDVNGLKSVNDLTSHEEGDIYLDRCVDCLKNSEVIKNFAEKYELTVTHAREGGDEFSFLIHSQENKLNENKEEENNLTIVQKLREIIIEEVSKIDCSDLMDFVNEKVQLDAYGQKLLKESGGDYKFFASVAGGEITFDEALKSVLEKIYKEEKDYNFEEFKYIEDACDKLMGEVQTMADARTGENKKKFKEDLLKGDASDRFTAYILSRNDEVKKLQKQLRELSVKKLDANNVDSLLEAVGKEKNILNKKKDELNELIKELYLKRDENINKIKDLEDELIVSNLILKELILKEKTFWAYKRNNNVLVGS